ncbi:hypothetical protein [Alicyclobacillus acidocaldarius]|uniref:Uncharacterized protein n=1 Tax=Alicyclobacillus acidocaldarius subsp. acidocaldarius (strain ATCC 27009 / DSM 446 / BCRC 14685 / JCM 5260 / KCTC 1825 / NBRC 15652 / NCIMB 11725 / NRRL B-14509 / 104-IA) TaxID=521098 RepID=C8WYM9_ALIAD|nr:hypothetical protein [Alicyclobacillus acidocaldarius]ACV60123.1 hypothetical protein Aaci_3127 [Alicyclobacillus acidocaldarius subsp. acidocaldarius DSM 446]
MKGSQASLTTTVVCTPRLLRRRTRGIGHFVAIALSAAATAGFFMIVYPVARQMMTSTVTAMQQAQQTVLNSTIGNST